jgi:hypothetical protein
MSDTEKIIVPAARRQGKATWHELQQAHRQARLRGTLEQAMQNPAIATCLLNLAQANQADPHRRYNLHAQGNTLYISPLPGKNSAQPDIKRRASGDDD